MKQLVDFRSPIQVPHRFWWAILFCLIWHSPGYGQAELNGSAGSEAVGFQSRVLVEADREHRYAVFVPHGYSEDVKWPVILFLHGAGERGFDGQRQVRVGLGRAIRAREATFPFIAVFPQCENADGGSIRRAWWADSIDGRRALKILDSVLDSFSTDSSRVYLSGLSMGGFGTWNMAYRYPERWAAVVPICGGGKAEWADRLAELPVWCFHGRDDRAVLASESLRMIEAIRSRGGKPKLTLYPNVGHNCWDRAYGTEALFEWLLKHRSKGKPTAPHKPPATSHRSYLNPDQAEVGPAKSILEIDNAVAVHIGTETLADLAGGIPALLGAKLSAGKLPDDEQQIRQEGIDFRVRMSGIRFAASRPSFRIVCDNDNTLLVDIAIDRIAVSIGRFDLEGTGRSAATGPTTVTLGQQTPLNIRIRIRPRVENRRVRFDIIKSEFRLQPGNLHVGNPAWVAVKGIGMSRDKVARGIREQLGADLRRFEREISRVIARLVPELESLIDFEQAGQMLAKTWPLPIHQPRMSLWPSQLTVDDSGITLTLGIRQLNWPGRAVTDPPRSVRLDGVLEDKSPNLTIALHPGVVREVSQTMIQQNLAKLLAEDLPMEPYRQLSDRDGLEDLVSGVDSYDEIRTEFSLHHPIELRPRGKIEQLLLPAVRVVVRGRRANEDWGRHAEFKFSLSQHVRLTISETGGKRLLSTDWVGEPTVAITSISGDCRGQLDVARMETLLETGWSEWAGDGPLTKIELADLELGSAVIRPLGVSRNGPFLAIALGRPTLSLTNHSSGPLQYQIRGPNTPWGGPFQIDPDKLHRYHTSLPMIFRVSRDDSSRSFTLRPGGKFEWLRVDGAASLQESRP